MKNKKYLILAVIWMAFIFYMSNQPADVSSAQSGGVIDLLSNIPIVGDLVRRLMEVDLAQFVIRKAAHLSAYLLLAVLFFMGMYDGRKNINGIAMKSFVFTFLYAVSDEIHQFFIPGRSCEFRDVMIDSSGGVIGILVVCIIIKFSNKYKLEK